MSKSLLSTIETRTKGYINLYINDNRDKTIKESNIKKNVIPYESRHIGKVRDIYKLEDYVIIVATDRQSAFDRNLASIPFKGQVLNMTSNWWFNSTKHLVPNHVIACPHPNVTIGKRCTIFPIEFVMRGYMTGTTSTSIWTHYKNGNRMYCGHQLPEGMIKNMKLPSNLLTPTTKDEHDVPISIDEIISSGRMNAEDVQICSEYAHVLFEFSVNEAKKRGIILVDTKYEFGKDEDGKILLVDEIQTPDSSRYWIKDSYEERLAKAEEPENIDKEFLRRWYVERCDPYKDEIIPDAPVELVNELSRRYLMLYEVITGETFDFTSPSPVQDTINEWLENQNK